MRRPLGDSILSGTDLCVNVEFGKSCFNFGAICKTVIGSGKMRTECNASEEA